MKVKIFNSRDGCRKNSEAEDRIRDMENILSNFLSNNPCIIIRHIATQPIDHDLIITILYDIAP